MWFPFDESSVSLSSSTPAKYVSRNVVSVSTPKASTPAKGSCEVCGMSSRTRCTGCDTVFYCSKKHQQTDWGKHKVLCRPFLIPSQLPTSKGKASKDKDDPKCNWMITTKEVTAGTVIFSEKPVVVGPNFPQDQKNRCCLGCFVHLERELSHCPRCLLPLCQHDCSDHTLEDCQAVAATVAKDRCLPSSASLIRDICILKTLQLSKDSGSAWSSVLALRTNPRFTTNLKNPTDDLKEWTDSEYAISTEYFQKHVKETKRQGVKFEEIVRIFAVFSDPAPQNRGVRVLYELRSWIPHACTPNAEFHFHPSDGDFTIYVKTVENVKGEALIYANYMSPTYDEGVSKSAIRLWNSSRLYCVEKGCFCRYPGRTDGSVGIRCPLITSTSDPLSTGFGNCPGYLAPVLDRPNPEKPNLGMLIYVKSRAWTCSRCRKSEKFSEIQKTIKEVVDRMKKEVDDYCADPLPSKYANVMLHLQTNLSNQHWLWRKVHLATLSSWKGVLGEGKEMLGRLMEIPPSEIGRANFLRLVSQKNELYGDPISQVPRSIHGQVTSSGLLSLISQRHGRLSFIRGPLLLDAFYTSLILFAEDFKTKLSNQLLPASSNLQKNTDSLCSEVVSKWRHLLKILNEAAIALSQPVFSSVEVKKSRDLALELSDVISTALTKSMGAGRTNSVMEAMKGFMESYCVKDPTFSSRLLPLLKQKRTIDIITKTFDPDSEQVNLDCLTFGPAYGLYAGQGEKGGAGDFMGMTDLPKWRRQRRHHDSDDSDASLFSEIDSLLDSALGGHNNDSETDSVGEIEREIDELFQAPMQFYEELLNDAVKCRLATDSLLRDIFRDK